MMRIPLKGSWGLLILTIATMAIMGCNGRQNCACGSYVVGSVLDSAAMPLVSTGEVTQAQVLDCMEASDSLRKALAEGRFMLEVSDRGAVAGGLQVKACGGISQKGVQQYVDCWMRELGEVDMERQNAAVEKRLSVLETEHDSLAKESDSLMQVLGEMRKRHPILKLENLFGDDVNKGEELEYSRNMRQLEISDQLMGELKMQLMMARIEKASIMPRVRIIDEGRPCE